MNTIITPVDGNAMIDTAFANATAASDNNCAAPADCACNAPESVTDSTAAAPTASSVPAPTSSPTSSPINVTVNQIVTGKVSRRKDRNAKGLLIEIDGNPMAYLPVIALAGRNRSERDARFASLVNAVGSEIEVAIVSAGMEEIKGVQMPRIKLSETKVFALRDEAARIDRENALIDAVSNINVGEVVSLTVTGPATTKSDKNDGSLHCFGVFVDVGGIKALLHVSEVAGDHPKAQRNRLDSIATGSTVEVEIIEARVEGGRAFVRVSEKAAEVKKVHRLTSYSELEAYLTGNKAIQPGCYLIEPPLVGADGRELRERALSEDVSVFVIVREPITRLNQWPIVMVGPVTVRTRLAPPKKPDIAWMLQAGEALGDHALAAVDLADDAAGRVEHLLELLSAVVDHEKLHQALHAACEETHAFILANPKKRGRPRKDEEDDFPEDDEPIL